MGKRHKAEEIVMKLKEIKLSINKGLGVVQACRQTGISNQSYYRWLKEYGGMKIDQAKRYKELEQENVRLKKENRMLKAQNLVLRKI
jgi:putative transposase